MNIKYIYYAVAAVVIVYVGILAWGLVDENAPDIPGADDIFDTIACPDKDYVRLEWKGKYPAIGVEPKLNFQDASWVDQQTYTGDNFGMWWFFSADYDVKVYVKYNEITKDYKVALADDVYTGYGAEEWYNLIIDTDINDATPGTVCANAQSWDPNSNERIEWTVDLIENQDWNNPKATWSGTTSVGGS